MIKHSSIRLPFVHELDCVPFFYPSNDDSSDTEAKSKSALLDPEQFLVPTSIYGTPHMEIYRCGCHIYNTYFDILNNNIHLWSPSSCEVENRLAYWWVKHNLCRDVINEHFRNPTMATVSNSTLSHTLFKRLYEMSFTKGIASCKYGKVS